jgi:hypothetical protein
MKSLASRAFLFFLIVLSGLASFADTPRIDHSRANLNGLAGFAAWPGTPQAGPRDPAGYEVVLPLLNEPQTWLRVPAGQWVKLPPNEYRPLLEGEFEVSPHASKMRWVNEPYRGVGQASVLTVVPAGRVKVDAKCGTAKCLAWLLHETSHNGDVATPGFLHDEMLRWSELELARASGVLMPSGPVAVAVYDAIGKEFKSLQILDKVAPRRIVTARPVAPGAGKAALIVEMERPAIMVEVPEEDVDVALAMGDTRLKPAFLVRAARRVTAIWNEVPSGIARLEVSSPVAHLPPTELRLRSGRVEHTKVKLAPFPKLGVRWSVPEQFRVPAAPVLNVVNLALQKETKIELDPERNPLTLSLPPVAHEITLRSGQWGVAKVVDLSDGADQSIDLEMRVIRVTGRVYSGDRGVPASITFSNPPETKALNVRADEDGNYETYFAAPGAYQAKVLLAGRTTPFVVPPEDVQEDRTLDFRLPSNEYLLRVRGSDGKPVPGARIALENRETDGIQVVQLLVTDEKGNAVAHPLRRGTVGFKVEARGFFLLERAAEPVIDSGSHTVDLILEPQGPTDDLTLRLPGGAPASGAQVMIDGSRGRRTEVADDAGRISLPQAESGALLLIKASGAAVSARRWGGGTQVWTLDRPTRPLVVRAVAAGGTAVPGARVVLWLDGVRLSGIDFSFLQSASPVADTTGQLVLRDLPDRPVHVLLWRYTKSNALAAQQNGLDAMRTLIPSWSTPVEVKVVE